MSRSARFGLMLLLLPTLVACAGVPLMPNGSEPLVTVSTRGGECPDGPCGTTVTLRRDGTVHEATLPPDEVTTIPAAQVATVAAAIDATDFAALRSRPFTGECPTAFDGQEIIFEFTTATGLERISTCEVEVDLGHPLFVAVATALARSIPLPLT